MIASEQWSTKWGKSKTSFGSFKWKSSLANLHWKHQWCPLLDTNTQRRQHGTSSVFLSLARWFARACALSVSLAFSLSRSLSVALALSPSCSLALSHSYSLALSHSCAFAISLSQSLKLSLSRSLALSLDPSLPCPLHGDLLADCQKTDWVWFRGWGWGG